MVAKASEVGRNMIGYADTEFVVRNADWGMASTIHDAMTTVNDVAIDGILPGHWLLQDIRGTQAHDGTWTLVLKFREDFRWPWSPKVTVIPDRYGKHKVTIMNMYETTDFQALLDMMGAERV